jgi:hypothetical protein
VLQAPKSLVFAVFLLGANHILADLNDVGILLACLKNRQNPVPRLKKLNKLGVVTL